MFNKFQQLPLGVKMIGIATIVGLVLGVSFLVGAVLNPSTPKPKPTNSGSALPITKPTPQSTLKPLTTEGQYNAANPSYAKTEKLIADFNADTRYGAADKTAATVAILDGYKAFCLVDPKETFNSRMLRIKQYFTPTSNMLKPEATNPLVSAQECNMLSANNPIIDNYDNSISMDADYEQAQILIAGNNKTSNASATVTRGRSNVLVKKIGNSWFIDRIGTSSISPGIDSGQD